MLFVSLIRGRRVLKVSPPHAIPFFPILEHDVTVGTTIVNLQLRRED